MKSLKSGRYELYALAIIICAVLLRLLLLGLGWPPTNSDEGTMGIMARHIAYNGEYPIYFYGQNYMGSIEAYLGAIFFHLFGPSLFSLRLSVTLLFALFLTSMYLLTSLLYTKKLALAVVALLSLGSNAMFLRELYASGGSTQTLLFGCLAFLVAIWLSLSYDHTVGVRLIALKTTGRGASRRGGRGGGVWCRVLGRLSSPWSSSDSSSAINRKRWLRLAGYTFWGLVVGLGLWSDLVVIPYFMMAGLLLVVFCWRDLRSLAPLCLLVGLAIGAFPLIMFNLHASPGQDSLSTIVGLFHGSAVQAPRQLAQYLQGIKATLDISLPTATGDPFCPVPAVNYTSDGSPISTPCDIIHTVWSLSYLLLWTLSVLLTIRVLWKLRSTLKGWSFEEKQIVIVHFARLFLLAAAGAAMASYAVSSAPLGMPHSHARYLVGLLIVTPTILWPLWNWGFRWGERTDNENREARGRPQGSPPPVHPSPAPTRPLMAFQKYASEPLALLSSGLFLLIGIAFLIGTISVFSDVPSAQAANQQQDALIHDLMHIGATHIYTDYWTCDRIAFVSNEQIICGVLDSNLQPTHNRETRYLTIVSADPHSAYVFPPGNSALPTVEQKVVADGGNTAFQRFVFDGYVVYQPK